MNRDQRNIYCFISDEAKMFCRAIQQPNGDYIVSKTNQPYPIKYNPSNLLSSPVEFATNNKYFSLNRTVTYPLNFIKDGAAILRQFYFLGKGTEEKAYLTILQWNGKIYELCYYGRFDFGQKEEDPKSGTFTVPTIDDTAWGILSQNDEVQYSIDCSHTNPKAIKILFTGITLLNRYTFQTVQQSIIYDRFNSKFIYTVPLIIVNQDGDSSGITVKDQVKAPFPYSYLATFTDESTMGWFFSTLYTIFDVEISGNFKFEMFVYNNSATINSLNIWFMTNKGQRLRINHPAIPALSSVFATGVIYDIPFDFHVNLQSGENIFLIIEYYGNNGAVLSPITTNIVVTTKTKQEPVIAYGLRPLDVLQQVVAKATNNRFTINSNWFTTNNRSIHISGDSLRGIPNAKLYVSFYDLFKDFDAINFMALREILGQLWIEKAIEVYKQDTTLLDIGEALDVKLNPALDYFCNEIEVGSPKQDYRHPSGRLEFNSTNSFSLPILTINKKLSIITKSRLGCYDIQFLLLDYVRDSSQDNSGDKSSYMVEISDTIGLAKENLVTFENVTIDNAPLQPIIKSPLNNDTITYNLPVIKGIAPPGSPVNIFVDNALDGSTVADVDGNWVYDIVNPLTSYELGVHTGIHVIDASYTDETAPKSTISILIDTTVLTPSSVIYPRQGDSLFNNKPLIKGIAQQGISVPITIDGVLVATVVADNSCKWEYKVVTPLSNRDHIVNGVDFFVDSNVAYPLITYIGSELDGFMLINNMPLIQGVAQPGTDVMLWLSYIPYASINPPGSAIADANGNWSYQTVPTNYLDPVSHSPVILVPIKNGLSVISTSLVNHTIGILSTGFQLSRPNYSLLLGVVDDTVFNTEYSPKRMLLNHAPLLASILHQQQHENIYFQTADKNGNLRTILDGYEVAENTDVPQFSLGQPLALLEYATIKTKALRSFSKTLEDFNKGGIIKFNFRGTDIFALPIGSMKIGNIVDDVQEWKVLLSPQTTYQSLLKLYKNGLTINIMKNSIYHSDYNSLHFVSYNFQDNPRYNFKTLYQDWFENRNDAWLQNPYYVQKFQTNDVITDQIVSNGVSNIVLRVYRCTDATLVSTIPYAPVAVQPINPPEIVLEAKIDLSLFPPDQYFFVLGLDRAKITDGIQIPIQQKTGGTFVFTLSGHGTIGDILSVNYILALGNINATFESTLQPNWTLLDLLNDMKTKIDADVRFGPATIVTVNGDLGISITKGLSLTGSVQMYGTLNIAISERVYIKDKWEHTILIMATNSINLTGAFFSTGFMQILRVEGLVKKLQPSIDMIIANEESGDNELLYSQVSRKRTVRFGTAYGLPDYLYLKIADALALDQLLIEGVNYVLDKSEKIQPSDDVDGHPLYYYNVILTLHTNTKGKVFPGSGLADETGVVLVADATAFGLPAGSLINISVD